MRLAGVELPAASEIARVETIIRGPATGGRCIKIIVDVGMRMISVEEIKAVVDEIRLAQRGGFGE